MRAKSHNQRKGQWVLNKLFLKISENERRLCNHHARLELVECMLYYMENDEFDRIMEGYDK